MTATGEGGSHQELTSELAALDRQLRDLSQQWEDVERTITEKTRRRRELIAQRPIFRHVAEQSPHDLARARLWELGREHDICGSCDLADLLSDMIAQLLEHLGRSVGAAFQGDEGHDRLSGLLVAPATDSGFC